MKELLRSIDQKCDDRVADFYNSLIALFLIQLFWSLAILGSITSPMLFFQDNLWVKLFGGVVFLLSPISILNGIYTIKSASWHFWNTLENRMFEWFN